MQPRFPIASAEGAISKNKTASSGGFRQGIRRRTASSRRSRRRAPWPGSGIQEDHIAVLVGRCRDQGRSQRLRLALITPLGNQSARSKTELFKQRVCLSAGTRDNQGARGGYGIARLLEPGPE